ncbi:hypothetical protein Pan241w_08280 [Gimesia alba]|uniref:Uncharacterized protein n=1 Tax=Gimesia alba TaxID=2527973 RepID=A0A517RA62_9PLAN|nr:hypothetical protein Pan241w_08280 [Gimesia alba]
MQIDLKKAETILKSLFAFIWLIVYNNLFIGSGPIYLFDSGFLIDFIAVRVENGN